MVIFLTICSSEGMSILSIKALFCTFSDISMETAIEIFCLNELILTIVPIPFCLLTLVIIVYYIRRRYKLYKEIKMIPTELLIMQSYQNHLKNLKIKCIISNFIILILTIEFAENISYAMLLLPDWIVSFDISNLRYFQFIFNARYYIYGIVQSLRLLFVPVLIVTMRLLWLIYMKSGYTYNMQRWLAYISLRSFLVLFLMYFLNKYTVVTLTDMGGYHIQIFSLSYASFAFLSILDYIQFVYYSRKFYLHLKSREKEIRLFYFDRKAYLDSKYLRIHFKVATILVSISLFFFTFGFSTSLFLEILFHASEIIPEWTFSLRLFYASLYGYLVSPTLIIYKLLINLNYLYVLTIITYKFLRDRKQLYHINKNIRPIVDKYHSSIYDTNYTKY